MAGVFDSRSIFRAGTFKPDYGRRNGAGSAKAVIADAYVDGGKAAQARAIGGIRRRYRNASGERDGTGARRCRSDPIGPAVGAMHAGRDRFA
ncbi:hypothetical protein [Burkholderia sola]|uniref:hypothetical protein n=1 Tax=Burkholderia sola TaxID=2843302 RepID=UPI00338E6144